SERQPSEGPQDAGGPRRGRECGLSLGGIRERAEPGGESERQPSEGPQDADPSVPRETGRVQARRLGHAQAEPPTRTQATDRAGAGVPHIDLDHILDPDAATVEHLAAVDTLNCFLL